MKSAPILLAIDVGHEGPVWSRMLSEEQPLLWSTNNNMIGNSNEEDWLNSISWFGGWSQGSEAAFTTKMRAKCIQWAAVLNYPFRKIRHMDQCKESKVLNRRIGSKLLKTYGNHVWISSCVTALNTNSLKRNSLCTHTTTHHAATLQFNMPLF